MNFADAEIFQISGRKWVLIIPSRWPEYYRTKRDAKSRLLWLRRWKEAQQRGAA